MARAIQAERSPEDSPSAAVVGSPGSLLTSREHAGRGAGLGPGAGAGRAGSVGGNGAAEHVGPHAANVTDEGWLPE